MGETRLRWLGLVQRRPIDAIMRKINCLEVTGTSWGRGRPNKNWIGNIKNDLKAL